MAQTLLSPGVPAPALALPDQTGSERTLEGFRGQRVVLYFYPKDDTPGCTTEACDFRDAWDRLTAAGIAVLGISPDSPPSHERFAGKYDLPFPLLADAGAEVARRYGAYGEKSLYGKTVTGMIRTTYVIDPQGRIERAYGNVRAKGHVVRLLRDLGLVDVHEPD